MQRHKANKTLAKSPRLYYTIDYECRVYKKKSAEETIY